MTRAEVEQLVERGSAGWRERNVDLLVSTRADDCVVESPAHGTMTGRAQIAEGFQAWLNAFPDARFDVTDLLVEGDRVVMMWRLGGTHSAMLLGLPATGRRLQIGGVSLYTLRDGLISHERRFYDVTALMVQMGILKARPS